MFAQCVDGRQIVSHLARGLDGWRAGHVSRYAGASLSQCLQPVCAEEILPEAGGWNICEDMSAARSRERSCAHGLWCIHTCSRCHLMDCVTKKRLRGADGTQTKYLADFARSKIDNTDLQLSWVWRRHPSPLFHLSCTMKLLNTHQHKGRDVQDAKLVFLVED